MKKENKILPIDLSSLREWITNSYGTKCFKKEFGCVTCEAWKIYDELKKLLES